MATEMRNGVTAPHRSRGWVYVVCIIFLLGVGAGLWAWRGGAFWPREKVFSDFKSGALEGYIPPGAAGVLAADLQQMRESPVVRDHLMGSMKKILERAEGQEKWITLVGADPVKDLDALQVAIFPGGSGRAPLWLARGRFDSSRFQTGPGKLQAKVADGYRVYEHRQAGQPVTYLAPAGDFLVISQDRAAVQTALNHAAGKAEAGAPDPALQKLLEKVNRKKSMWLAVAFDKVGRVGELQNLTLDKVLRPVFEHAQAVYGGINCGKDLTADFHMPCRDGAGAQNVEGALNSSIDVAKGAALLSFGSGTDLQPVIALIASGQVSREGTTVRLQCNVPADRLH